MNWCQPFYSPDRPKKGNAPVEAATEARSNTDESPDKPSEAENNTASVTVSAPEALRMLPGWLVWRSEQNEGEAKPRKVPYYVGSRQRRKGRQGEPEDRRQLVTFAEAMAVAQSGDFSGVGFAPMPEWGITALDFDNCVTDGLLDPTVEKLVGCTYAEYSPSGKGVRAFMRGTLKDKKSAGEPFGFETFCHKGFVTFTGRPLEICELIGAENTVADLTPEILELYESRFGLPDMPAVGAGELSPISLTVEQIKACLAALPKDLPYEASAGTSWLGVGMALHHETQGSDAGFNLWDEWSATSPKYSSREYGEPKWRSFGRSDKSITGRSLVKWANDHGAQISFGVATADDFEAIEEPKAEPRKPRSAGEILAMQFASLNWVVPKILPEGVYLLVASPKIGKS